MNTDKDIYYFKCTHIDGLSDVVVGEMQSHSTCMRIDRVTSTAVYTSANSDQVLSVLKSLRSVISVYITTSGALYNPGYISRHKSIVGELVKTVLYNAPAAAFRTFSISCAGNDTPEVVALSTYIQEHFGLVPADAADMEITIGKSGETWEVCVRVSPRPLSVRDYQVAHVPGGINATVAYAMNTVCEIGSATSYLNICSGAGTLLVEAGLMNETLRLVGFDIDGKRNAQAVQNFKKAGLVKRIQLKTADIFDMPDMGLFDIIVSDLPFGMQIGKGDNIVRLYQVCVQYCEKYLSIDGCVVLYTTERDSLYAALQGSSLTIVRTIPVRLTTSVNSYIFPNIFVCKRPG